MKKIFYILLIAICVATTLFFNGNEVGSADSGVGQLNKFADALDKKGIKVSNWYLYAREEKNQSMDDVLGKYRSEFPEFNWMTKDLNKKVIGVAKHSSVTEQIIVTSTSDHSSYVIFELRGNKWNKESQNATIVILKKSLRKIFNNQPTIFSCVKGTMGGKIEGVLQGINDDFLKTFHATKIEEIKEGAFISVSAYTEKWNDALVANGKKINLQIAIRENKVDESKTIILGTPIITVEY